MSVKVTHDRIIIEIPSTEPTTLYADLSSDLLTLVQEASDPERPVLHRLWNVLELSRAMVADEKTFAAGPALPRCSIC